MLGACSSCPRSSQGAALIDLLHHFLLLLLLLIIIVEATQAVCSIRRGRAWGRTWLGTRHDIQLHCPDHHTDYDYDDVNAYDNYDVDDHFVDVIA